MVREELVQEKLLEAELFNRMMTELCEDSIGTVATLVLSYVKSVSRMLH